MDELPPREEIKNFLGQPVPEFVYGKLQGFHTLFKARKPSVKSVHFMNAGAGGFNMR
jgi:hypothetical protein